MSVDEQVEWPPPPVYDPEVFEEVDGEFSIDASFGILAIFASIALCIPVTFAFAQVWNAIWGLS